MGAGSKSRRPNLYDVTVCAADCVCPQLAARAIEICMERCDFADAILFSDAAVAGRFRHVTIGRLKSLDDYSSFCLRELPAQVNTPFVLVVQWDGYIVNADMWGGVFRKYDYIGAPIYNGDTSYVGNGGFSMRSRKLLDALPQLAPPAGIPEDVFICVTQRAALEHDFNIRFAPINIASRFSYETRYLGRATFGFHSTPNLWRHESDSEIIRIFEELPPRAIVTYPSYILITNCLQHGRRQLAAKLYARARLALAPDAIAREMIRSLPRPIVSRIITMLEEAVNQ